MGLDIHWYFLPISNYLLIILPKNYVLESNRVDPEKTTKFKREFTFLTQKSMINLNFVNPSFMREILKN